MMPGLSRALVAVAAGCLGETRRDWAQAMEAELDAARADGRSLSFAAGCLMAALRQMPRQAEGRLQLANHALALGLLVPVAFLLFGLSSGQGGLYGATGAAGAADSLLGYAQLRAVPALLISWLLLGVGHLLLAWTLLDRDWTRVVGAGALIAAASLTLYLFMGVLLLDAAVLRLLPGVLAVELLLVLGIARWHARIFTHPRSPQAS